MSSVALRPGPLQPEPLAWSLRPRHVLEKQRLSEGMFFVINSAFVLFHSSRLPLYPLVIRLALSWTSLVS